jgi:hypothetical protein
MLTAFYRAGNGDFGLKIFKVNCQDLLLPAWHLYGRGQCPSQDFPFSPVLWLFNSFRWTFQLEIYILNAHDWIMKQWIEKPAPNQATPTGREHSYSTQLPPVFRNDPLAA